MSALPARLRPLAALAALLLAIVALEVATLAWGGSSAEGGDAVAAGGAKTGAPATPDGLIADIMGRPLFSTPRTPPPPPPPAQGEISPKIKLVRLTGVALMSDVKYAWIEVLDEDAPEKVEEGDTIADIWTVKEIAPGSVTLTAPGEEKTLTVMSSQKAIAAWRAAHPEAVQQGGADDADPDAEKSQN